MQVFINNVKTALLLGALMALFLLVGSQWGTGGIVIAFIFGGLMNVGAFFFSDTIAIKAMQAREVKPGESSINVGGMSGDELHQMVDELRRRADLPMPKVYICPHEAPNAFATGRSPKKAAVAVTAGLLQMMKRDEIEGVIAHELAHVKHRDTLISCIAATIAGVMAFLAYYGIFFIGGRRGGGNPLVMIGTVILAAVGAAVIKAMISRAREYVADAEDRRFAQRARQRVAAAGRCVEADPTGAAQPGAEQPLHCRAAVGQGEVDPGHLREPSARGGPRRGPHEAVGRDLSTTDSCPHPAYGRRCTGVWRRPLDRGR